MKRTIGALSTRAAFAPKTVNESRRTVDIVWSTGERVLRNSFWDGPSYEELSMDPKHVRLDRLNSGTAPFLADHDSRKVVEQVGVIESARIENGKGVATVRFAAEGVDPVADMIFAKVRDGIIANVSVGYRTHRAEPAGKVGDIPVFRSTDWQPFEVSAVAIGADSTAHFRSDNQTQNECVFIDANRSSNVSNKGISADTQLERERVSGIRAAVRAGKLDPEFETRLIDDGTSLEQARALVLDRLVTKQEETDTRNHQPSIGYEGVDDRIRTMAEALSARGSSKSPKLSAEAQQYSRMSMVDMARHCLEMRRISTRLMSPAQIVTRAFGAAPTSDFPHLLQESGTRLMQEGFQSYAGGLRRIARKVTSPDFRPRQLLRLSEAPGLLKVPEGAEYKSGTLVESKESYRVETYGRVFGLTRQAVISDDLGAFSDPLQKFGRAASEFINQQLVDALVSNPTMGDGEALFSVAHGNLAASPGAIDITTLTAALKAMRLMKDLDDRSPIDVEPRFLVVPAALEIVARQYTAQINAWQASNVNPFGGMLEVIVEPRLDAASASTWYLAAAPESLACLEYSFLDGYDAPHVEMDQEFLRDVTRFKVRLDLGVGAVEHRGLYKNGA